MPCAIPKNDFVLLKSKSLQLKTDNQVKTKRYFGEADVEKDYIGVFSCVLRKALDRH